jgi:hypothetical protein
MGRIFIDGGNRASKGVMEYTGWRGGIYENVFL